MKEIISTDRVRIKKYYTESKMNSCLQYKEGRLTGLIASFVATAN